MAVWLDQAEVVDGVAAGHLDPVQAPPDLAGVTPSQRTDKDLRLVEDKGTIYRFDEQSSAADADGPPPITVDTDGVIIPDDNPATGRWIDTGTVAHTHVAADVTDFASAVAANAAVAANTAHASSDGSSHANVPTAGQKAALPGTDGTPGVSNKYLTDSDPRNTDARTPTAHKGTHASGGSDPFVAADVLEAASRAVRISLRNESGSPLSKGDLVSVSGFSVPEGRPIVDLADKDLAAFRPAIAVVEASVADNTNFEGLVVGLLTGLDTSSFVVNAQLVLGDDGAVSSPPPDTDPFTGEVQLIGSVVRSDVSAGSIYYSLSSSLLPMTAAQFFWTKEIATTGLVTGGDVIRATGLNTDVALGEGFINTGSTLFRISWVAVTNLLLTASDTNHIFVDSTGVVQASTTLPSSESNIILATAITDGTDIIFLSNHKVLLEESASRNHQYVQDVVGPIAVSGIITTLNATPLRLDVDSGTFYIRAFRVTVPATTPITFTYWHRDGSGGFTKTTGQTVIDKDNWDDGTGTLNSLVAGEWKKDLLFVVPTSSGAVEYHVFYGQEVFASQVLAEGGNLPAADSDVLDNGIRSSGIVIEGASATIDSVVDVRPFLGQLSPGTTAVTDHGGLSGLADNDHPQYQLGSEKNSANGYAGLDGSTKLTGSQQVYGSATNTAAEGDDSRLSDSRAPNGAASGDLAGTYPSPTIGLGKVLRSYMSALRATEQGTPNTTALVALGDYLKADGSGSVAFAGGSSPAFAVVSADSRIDLLSINDSGTLVITQGVQAASPVPPVYPKDSLPIAEVTIDETSGVLINTADIKDVRPFLNLGARNDIRFDDWKTKAPDEGTFAAFSGTPSIESSLRDFTDEISYRKVKSSGSAEDGGLVYEFVVPDEVSAIAEISIMGKVGNVLDQIDVEVKEMNFDGTSVVSLETDLAAIQSLSKTQHNITSFATAPTLTAGQIILVEIKAVLTATGRDASIGPCRIHWDRTP